MFAFLGDPENHDPVPDNVERIDTHGAVVFLAGPSVYKVKRAVRYAYMDYSTLDRRHAMCQRELEINRITAPQIYLGVVPITREADGALAIDGAGTPVEWALHMRRFDQDALLATMAQRGLLDAGLIKALAAVIEAFHRTAPPAKNGGGANAIAEIVTELNEAFARQNPKRSMHRLSTRQHGGSSNAPGPVWMRGLRPVTSAAAMAISISTTSS